MHRLLVLLALVLSQFIAAKSLPTCAEGHPWVGRIVNLGTRADVAKGILAGDIVIGEASEVRGYLDSWGTTTLKDRVAIEGDLRAKALHKGRWVRIGGRIQVPYDVPKCITDSIDSLVSGVDDVFVNAGHRQCRRYHGLNSEKTTHKKIKLREEFVAEDQENEREIGEARDSILPPGDYRDLTVESRGVLRLMAGVYRFRKILLGSRSSIEIPSGVDSIRIEVASTVTIYEHSSFITENFDSLASRLSWIVGGRVLAGDDVELLGTWHVPTSEFRLGARSLVVGSVFADVIVVEKHASLRAIPLQKKPSVQVRIIGDRRFWTNLSQVPVRWMIDSIEQDSGAIELLPNEGIHSIVRCAANVCDTIIALVDRTAPRITIESPADGSSTRISRIELVWSIDGEILRDSSLLAEGFNHLQRGATDSAGNSGSTFINVVLDTHSPSVQILSPKDGSQTNQRDIPLRWSIDGVEQPSMLLALNEGMNTIRREATDAAGNIGSDVVNILLDTKPPEVSFSRPIDGLKTSDSTIELMWVVDGKEQPSEIVGLIDGQNIFQRSAKDEVGNIGSSSLTIIRIPDPAIGRKPVLAKVQPGTFPKFSERMRSLIEGPNAIQFDVVDSAFTGLKTAVLNGVVVDRDGAGLGGVQVSISGRPEWGWTKTQANGTWNLYVGGGGLITLDFQKSGWLSSQRKLLPRPFEVSASDTVAMVRLDSRSKLVSSGSDTDAILISSTTNDARGERTALVMIPAGTNFIIRSEDGTERLPAQLTLRATEYTVGPRGPEAMPGDIPPGVAYTYAIEVGADGVGPLESVIFDKPVHMIVENFLDFPTGISVPLGWYDRKNNWWVPESSGVIVKVVGVTDGVAELDANGDGLAESLVDLLNRGWTEAQLRQLGTRYPVGTSLWSVFLPHLTPWDCNWPYGFPADARIPEKLVPEDLYDYQELKENSVECGSIIGVENQMLCEIIDIPGTNVSFGYSSQRTIGFDPPALRVPVEFSKTPQSVIAIEVIVDIEGQRFSNRFSRGIDTDFEVKWNGLDALGMPAFGGRGYVTVRQIYPGVYGTTTRFAQTEPFPLVLGGNRVALEVYTEQTVAIYVPASGRGGDKERGNDSWLLSAARPLDWDSKQIPLLNGGFESVSLTLPTDSGSWRQAIIIPASNNIQHKSMQVFDNGAVCVISNGKIQCATTQGMKYSESGEFTALSKVSGNKLTAWGTVGEKTGLFRGNLDLTNWTPICIPSVRWTSPWFYSQTEGARCEDVQINTPTTIAEGPNGDIFLAQYQAILKVTVDGRIYSYAGGPTGQFNWDSTLAGKDSRGSPLFQSIKFIEPQADGSLIVGDYFRVLRIDANQKSFLEMGTNIPSTIPDGFEQSLTTELWYPEGSVTLANNELCVADQGTQRVICKNEKGELSLKLYRPTRLIPWSMDINSSGLLCISGYMTGDMQSGVWCQSELDTSRYSRYVLAPQTGVASTYNQLGQPINVIDPLFRFPMQKIEYDEANRPLRILEDSVDTTSFSYPTHGVTLIQGPKRRDSKVTKIERNDRGLIAYIELPDGRRHSFAYNAQDLLVGYITPTGLKKFYGYNSFGRLLWDSTEGTTAKRLIFARDNVTGVSTVSVIQPSGKVIHYQNWTHRDTTFRTTGENLKTSPVISSIANKWSEIRYADGSGTRKIISPDPQWGLAIPKLRDSSWNTDGTWSVRWTDVSVELDDAFNPMSLRKRTESEHFETSGRFSRQSDKIFDIAARTVSAREAANRTITKGFDQYGYLNSEVRKSGDVIDTLLRVEYSRDRRFMLQHLQWSVDSIWFDAEGLVDSIYRPGQRKVRFERDLDGRVLSIERAGVRSSFSYDSEGRIQTLTPSGRNPHSFVYGSWGDDSAYLPPSWDSLGGRTQVIMDQMGRVSSQIHEADTVSFGYDGQNRVSSVVLPGAQIGLNPDGPYSPSYEIVRQDLTVGTQSFRLEKPDSRNTIQRFTGPVTGYVGWQMSADGQSADMLVEGQNVGYSWTQDGLVQRVGSAYYSYRPHDNALDAMYLGSIATFPEYDSLDRLTGSSTGTFESEIWTEHWKYDDAGRILQRRERLEADSVVWDYQYDSLGRLSGVARSGVTWGQYGYDENGNRTFVQEASRSTTATFDAQDRVVQSGGRSFSYDDQGRLSWRAMGQDTTRSTFDVLGNLLRVDLSDGHSIEYLIDGHNRRVGRKVDGRIVQAWLYDGQQRIVAELDGNGHMQSRFVYGARDHVADYMIRDNRLYRLVSDHLGSVRAVIDAETGGVVSRIDYDIWGNTIHSVNLSFQPFGFAGGLRDDATGLTRFGARDYDPQEGRWLSKDPIGFDGGQTDLYEYAHSDPVNFMDPDGKISFTISGGTGLGGSLTIGYDINGLFVEGVGGFSSGFGFSINPVGKYSAVTKCGHSSMYVGFGVTASGGFPLYKGVGIGGSYTLRAAGGFDIDQSGQVVDIYNANSWADGWLPGFDGIGLGGGLGVSGGIAGGYQWGKDECECK